jgi:asparagine synthase (glutamine-hydrolysing)
MCGLAGIVNLEGGPSSLPLLLRMSARIRHRGPDDEGYALLHRNSGAVLEFGGPTTVRDVRSRLPLAGPQPDGCYDVALAHRRYSIIDLTSGGHQPFFDSARSCCIVYNGEIYNYLELREELRKKGHSFRTASDTEVVVEAYKEWAEACFQRFNGMWALALFDFARRRLILSRDRVGKRPLYWTQSGKYLYFASEIKALLEAPEISTARQVNEGAIAPFLSRGLRDLGLSTFFRGVKSLPAASVVTVTDCFPDAETRFWSPPRKRWTEKEAPVTEAAQMVQATLSDAVRLRLRSDVAWAAELSGGMDSSALVALAKLHSPAPVVTYTVRFDDKKTDESAYAEMTAAFCGAESRVVQCPTDSFWAEAPAFTDLEEEPYHSPNLHTNQLVRRRMRGEGIGMLLNGAGGDELFAGYPEYFRVFGLQSLREMQLPRYLSNCARWSEASTPLPGLLSPFLSPLLNRGRFPDSLGDRLLADLLDLKIPYWLRSGDKTHMGIPIESRQPFLDYRMVELAFQLPLTYLIRDGWHKWILRKALEGLIPSRVLWRRRKMGFPFPYSRFLNGRREIVAQLVSRATNPYLKVRLGIPKKGAARWRQLSFLLWYELFFNQNRRLLESLAERAPCPKLPGAFEPEFLKGVGI